MRKKVFAALTGLILLGTLLFTQFKPAQPALAAPGGSTNTSTATTTQIPTNTATPTTTQTATNTTTPTITQSATNTSTPTTTPTMGTIRMPLILKDPTRTPTPTNTATVTPTPTKTATITPTPTKTSTGVPGATGLTGTLARVEPNKPTYATRIENIYFYENIFNPTGNTIGFGVLGLQTTGPQANIPFQTSWSGGGAPGGQLQIFAGCHGPAGIPCAGSADAGRHADHIGNAEVTNAPNDLNVPGSYTVRLYVCYSNYNACLQPGGNWVQLGNPSTITLIDWTPSPGIVGQDVTPTPDYGPKGTGSKPLCYLITDDPAGIYLSCVRPEAKYLHLPRH